MSKINPEKPNFQEILKEEGSKEKIQGGLRELLSFSFKYFEANDKFNPYGRQIDYFTVLLDRLKEASKLSATELRNNPSKTWRSHGVNWSDPRVSEDSFGLPNEEQLVDEAWQFSLRTNNYGRIIGFFIDTKFFIVWADCDHQLYPGD